ncbi:MAG: kynureninase [Lachnospiraceae bacterium]|nr:kynureninase [Lachnospiraceae bacterium]
MNKYGPGREFAVKMDAEDELSRFKERFYRPQNDPGIIYMDGNSLGLLSVDAEETLMAAVETWKKEGIDIWGKGGYLVYQDKLGKMCAPLIGADPEEVTVGGSTTVNIHTAVATFYGPVPGRNRILVDDLNFPSDRYAIASQIRVHGYDPDECLKTVKSRDGRFIYEDDIIEAMTEDVCLVLLPSALYRSAQLIDMKKIADAAHERGIIAGFDLCHSIGAVPHDFADIQPDFAVWCTYKYLNAGPGAVAGLYINRKHFGKSGLSGWWGNDKSTQFDLKPEFEPEMNAGGWQIGTGSILSMAPLEGSLKMYAEAGIGRLRTKSLKLTGYLMELIDEKLARYGFSVGNPREDERRTGHVALVHEDAIRINAAMKAEGILPDFRFPDVIRLAPVPLYTSFTEVYDMVERITDIMENRKYEAFENRRGTVA